MKYTRIRQVASEKCRLCICSTMCLLCAAECDRATHSMHLTSVHLCLYRSRAWCERALCTRLCTRVFISFATKKGTERTHCFPTAAPCCITTSTRRGKCTIASISVARHQRRNRSLVVQSTCQSQRIGGGKSQHSASAPTTQSAITQCAP